MRKFVPVLVLMLLPSLAIGQNPLPPGTQLPDAGGQDSAVQAGDMPLLNQAEDKIAQGDFEGARPLIEKYIGLHPSDARALYDAGFLEDGEGKGDAAAADYRKAIAANPKQFESRLALGLLLAHEGKWAEAKEQLEAATQLEPAVSNPEAKARAFRALAQLDRSSDPEAAKKALLTALSLSPETPGDLLLTAEIAEANNDDESAETAYRRLLNPGTLGDISSEATAGLVQLLLRQQKYSEGEPLLKSALGRDPDNPALNAQLATDLIGEGKKEEAVPVLEKLRQSTPGDFSIDQMLADAYSQADLPGKAEPIYAEMAKSHPGDPQLLADQGANLLKEAKYPEAQAVFAQAVKLKPDDGYCWGGLAFAAHENQQYEEALLALSMRAKYLQENATTYFLWATSYDSLHHTKAAADYYKKFLASADGKFPDQELQARHRLAILGHP